MPVADAQVTLGSNSNISYSNPRQYEIGGVSVEGANNLDEGAIRLLSGLNIGDEISVPGDETAEAIRKLWKQDLFSDVQLLSERVEGDKIYLIIKIQERPRLSRFGFSGVSKSEADDLREKINLYKEKIVTENLMIATKQKVYNYYADKGFLDAEVNLRQEQDSIFRTKIRLYIDVDKKKKIKIDQINVKGNSFYSDYQVRRTFKETKDRSVFKPFHDLDTLGLTLWRQVWKERKQMPITTLRYGFDHIKVRIFKSSKYLKKNFAGDKDILIAKYNQKGFRDAKVVSDSVYKSGDRSISMDLRLAEGHQYYFRNIKWIGNTKYPSSELSDRLGIQKGDIYDPQKLEARLYMDQAGGDVSSLYMDNGYLFFQLEPVEILVGIDSIDMEIRMYEGEQARINRISVSGNTKTNDHVILRELYTMPGQLFSRADIIRSQQQLNVLGFFDPESMDVRPTPDPTNGTVDIEYVVTEKPNDQLTLQGGYGGGILVATVGVQFNNFSTRNILKPKEWNGPLPTGDGQKLGINFNTNGRQYQAFNASFTEPWLGGKKPTSLTLSGFYSFFTLGANNRKYNEDTDGNKVFNASRAYFQRLGATAQLGKRLKWPDNYFSLVFETSAQQYTLQNYDRGFAYVTGQSYNLYGKFILSRRSIDDNIFPSMGSDMTFSGQFTPTYSYFNGKDYSNLEPSERFKFLEYHKWKFSWGYYTGLLGQQRKHKLVLYTKIGFGVLGYYNRNVGDVPFERFYLGGDPFSTTCIALGGIDSREFISLRGYGGGGLSPTEGATLINKYTMELRYPFSLSQSFTAYGLAFAEAGNSWDGFNSYNPFEVYKSTGVGIRIFLPMFGLLGVDW
ncbi:MAG TPA: outer membrane protein assembly factor BamA, partial [Flavobacteriales bacterium]|nr:outer membrane protein assembly factor BamA [Flavobacteriales bacterium]